MTTNVIRYRVHCEHVAPALVTRAGFQGFSITACRGYWQGKAEQSHVVEILGEAADKAKVLTLAAIIREQYRQTEVWITSESVELLRVTIDAVKEGFSDTRNDAPKEERLSA